MFWIIKSIIVTFALTILTFSLFGSPHIEIGNSFFFASWILSITIMISFHLIFKYYMPKSYAKYKDCKDRTFLMDRITILPLFGYLIFFTFFFSYINQHNLTSPIETIKTRVMNKSTGFISRRNAHYIKIYISPIQTLEIDSKKLYEMLNVDDVVTVKIQKGRLNNYFALELTVEKNNYSTLL